MSAPRYFSIYARVHKGALENAQGLHKFAEETFRCYKITITIFYFATNYELEMHESFTSRGGEISVAATNTREVFDT